MTLASAVRPSAETFTSKVPVPFFGAVYSPVLLIVPPPLLHLPGESRRRSHRLAELVQGRGRELLRRPIGQRHIPGRYAEAGNSLNDGHGDAADGGQAPRVGDGDLEGVSAGAVEGGRGVLGGVGAVAALQVKVGVAAPAGALVTAQV